MTRAVLLLCLALPTAATALPPLPDSDPEVAWALVRDEWLPELEARRASADARIAARRDYFAGQTTLADAFPRLVDSALTDPAVLVGRLQSLDARLRARVRERTRSLESLEPRRRSEVHATLEAALDAEDAADALERRLLVARQTFVEEHPTWASEAAVLRVPLERQLDALGPRVDSDDPEIAAAAAAEARALDDERMALRAWTRALAERHVRPTTELPPIDAEGLEQPWGELVLARLQAIDSALPEAVPELDAMEIRWIEAVGLPAAKAPLPTPPGDLAAALARAEVAVAQHATELEALPEAEPDTLTGHRRALAEARLDRAERWLALLREADTSTAGTEAERAREQAERAREEADEAREQADDAVTIAAAEARATAANAQERAAQAWEQARSMETELVDARSARLRSYTTLSSQTERIVRPVLGEPLPSADETYARLRTLIADLRTDASTASEHARTAVQAESEALSVHAAERRQIAIAARLDPPLADRWEGALDDEARAWAEAAKTAEDSRDLTMRLLAEAKELRRTLSGYVSSTERARDRADLFANVGQEIKLAGPNLVSRARERIRELVTLPSRLTDFSLLTGLVRSSFLTLLFTALWWFARSRTEDVVGALLVRIRKQYPNVRPTELRGLRAPLLHVGIYSLDLIAGWLLREPLAAIAPELGIVVFVWLQIALFRWVIALFDVLVVRHPERRPAWLILNADTHDLARRTLRFALLWWILRRASIDFTLQILGADAVSEALGILFMWIGVALLLWFLYTWHGPLLARVRRLHQGSSVVRFLSRDPHWTLRIPHSLAMLVYLAAALGWDLLDRVARRQAGVGRLFNAMNRYRLGQEEKSDTVTPLDPEVLDSIRLGNKGVLRRQTIETEILADVDAWQDERRRGLIALVGDRGEGKGVLLDQIEPRLSVDDRPARRITLTRRIRTESEALAWIGEVLGSDGRLESTEAAVEALTALPPSVFIVEDLHLAFLRTVGGFEGLNTLLYVFNATCADHLWLVTLHAPAWRYLTRLGGMVDTGIFRKVFNIPALGEEELRDLTQRRLSIAGLTADFSPLVRTNPFGTDPEVELERTISVFYRLLAEASQGNPAVALHLFADCLSADPDRDDVVLVRLRKTLSGNVDTLLDNELFALTAIRTQANLTLDELVEVTNMGLAPLRQIVKNLESQGLLDIEQTRFSIPGVKLPAVTRTLRRRHFLHGAG